MNLLRNLITIFQQARKNEQRLTYDETLTLLKSIKEISIDKLLVEKVIDLLFISKNKGVKIKNLSRRQTQIFVHIGLGFSSREIGDLLQISEATVSTHRKQMIKKLGLSGAGKLQFAASQYVQNKLYS